jgi:eukaryotic translation initiation factor 2C
MVLIFDKEHTLYANIKHLGEIVLGIPTQVVLKRNVLKPDYVLAHNICLKINSKLGGTNQMISKNNTPAVLKRPVNIFIFF